MESKFGFGKMPVMAAPNMGGTLNIYVFGEISCWWGLNKIEVLHSLKGNNYTQINLVISSNGGDLAEALVIRDLLKAYPANVTTYLTGVCASAATILADAGDTVVMSKQCVYMIHKPLFQWMGGNADDLRKGADILDTWETIVVDIYKKKTGMADDKIRTLMQDVSWLGANEALSLGFVDEVVDVLEIDFELDATGLGECECDCEEEFICDKIDFKNSKTIFNQAVSNALKGGYRQISPAMMQGLSKKEKTFEMKDLFKTIVNALVSAGFISVDKKDAAIEAAANLETPEMLANLVKEEVAKQVQNVATKAPSMKATDVVKLIADATDEEKAEIGKALNVQSFDPTELKTQIADLAGKVATAMTGQTGGANGNGDSGIEMKEGKKELSYKEKQAAQMYLDAYNAGHIDASMYKNLTKMDAPKRGVAASN